MEPKQQNMKERNIISQRECWFEDLGIQEGYAKEKFEGKGLKTKRGVRMNTYDVCKKRTSGGVRSTYGQLVELDHHNYSKRGRCQRQAPDDKY